MGRQLKIWEVLGCILILLNLLRHHALHHLNAHWHVHTKSRPKSIHAHEIWEVSDSFVFLLAPIVQKRDGVPEIGEVIGTSEIIALLATLSFNTLLMGVVLRGGVLELLHLLHRGLGHSF